MNTKEVQTLLGTEHVKFRNGVFTYWVSYYWGVTKSPDTLVSKVKEKVPHARIVESGNHYHAFVGGAKSGSKQDSYLWVTFTFPTEPKSVTFNQNVNGKPVETTIPFYKV